ncbi:Hypothetical predicted protein [Olea europaea subsp. europaea]|uniref:Uncharacterized protein n=1 Tax=Olea europaea subsp. europaea TaxID=158383 RepID=A0A8S0TTF6_OLEEU|nr:Hypothetical predicted protein [Olea europaea subsp. europaea]
MNRTRVLDKLHYLSLLGSLGGPILIFIKPESKYIDLAAVHTMTEDVNMYNLTAAANMYNLNEVFHIMAALFSKKIYEDTQDDSNFVDSENDLEDEDDTLYEKNVTDGIEMGLDATIKLKMNGKRATIWKWNIRWKSY